jgi:hypothetical protein
VITKPLASSSTRPESQPVLGAAPIMMNSAAASIRLLPVGLGADHRLEPFLAFERAQLRARSGW